MRRDLRRWSYWPDLNRRPADYERSYMAFSLAAPEFSGLSPRLFQENQQVNYPVSAFSSAVKTTFCGQLLGQTIRDFHSIECALAGHTSKSGTKMVFPFPCRFPRQLFSANQITIIRTNNSSSYIILLKDRGDFWQLQIRLH